MKSHQPRNVPDYPFRTDKFSQLYRNDKDTLDHIVRTKFGSRDGYKSRMEMDRIRTIHGWKDALYDHVEGTHRAGTWMIANNLLTDDEKRKAETSFTKNGSSFTDHTRAEQDIENGERLRKLRHARRARPGSSAAAKEEDDLTRSLRREFDPVSKGDRRG